MTDGSRLEELIRLARIFGPEAAARKLLLLKLIGRTKRLSARRLCTWHDTLYFLLAYPDSPAVLAEVREQTGGLRRLVEGVTGGDPGYPALESTGLPATTSVYGYSYGVVQRLAAIFPGLLEIDWADLEDEVRLNEALSLVTAPAESRGLDDERLSFQDWLQDSKSEAETDLEAVLRLFAESTLTPEEQGHIFEGLDLQIRFPLLPPGAGRCETTAPRDRIHFQKRPIPREGFPLAPRIRKPLDDHRRLTPGAGRRMIDLSLGTLCTRNLEIYPLIHANPDDVTEVRCGRGIEVALVGTLPGFRTTPETLYFFLILKNGVPIAYGPASIFLGQCEMGVNLFPEFRAGEIRFIYAQFMRAVYHLAGARYFVVVPYGMGRDNKEALESGAFWFYRKLGFRATNPEVEALARSEEAVMRREPGYRSSLRTLRRLSDTHAFLDLSGRGHRMFDLGRLGRAVTRMIRERYRGNRNRARRDCTRRLQGTLEIGDFRVWTAREKDAMGRLAPLFSLIPDLADWSARDRRNLAAGIRARGRPDEFAYIRYLSRIPRLAPALKAAEQRDHPGSDR